MIDSPAAEPAAVPPLPAETVATPAPRVLEIRFTASGSEYFRIWAVNLLLILVTLGFYIPFAKARRIRYFYANTLVDGQALSFHGDPWKMFRGFVVLVVAMGAYSAAGHWSPTAAIVAFLVLCIVWPALWRASLQFRLANTAWRGLRMRFQGSLKDAYLACAPVYLPSLAMLVAAQRLGEKGMPQAEAMQRASWYFGALGVVMLLAPWSLALFKRYQHNGYGIAGQQARVRLSTAKLYLLALKLVGVAILPSFVAGIIAALTVGLTRALGPASLPPAAQTVLLVVGVGLGYLAMFAFVMPYGAARLQNLVWNGTRSDALRFRSALRYRSLLGLTFKNWLLTALTLGLYRPFAAVATARLRLQAVHIDCKGDPAEWLAAAHAGHADATGDISGDFFGIDMGL